MIVIATSVPILVWAVSLGLEWQAFDPLQFLGFLLIVVGNLIFNDILIGKVFFQTRVIYVNTPITRNSAILLKS